MIHVTNDQVVAVAQAGKIVVLCDGRLEQAGSSIASHEQPANVLIVGFFGSSAIMLSQTSPQGEIETTGWDQSITVEVSSQPERSHAGSMDFEAGQEHVHAFSSDSAQRLDLVG